MRRTIVALAVASLVLALLPTPPASSTPVATSEAEYQALGRVFPDPHGCHVGEPGYSPFAKGRACAVDFLQFEEMAAGSTFLEQHFKRFFEFYRLDRDFACNGRKVNNPENACKAFRSAGLPVTIDPSGSGFVRARKPLYMIRVTDEAVPNKRKKYFVFPVGIHGIERAGVEGGVRAAEDLATWAACEAKKAPAFVDCNSPDNKAPHALLEATPKRSVTAGSAMRRSVVYFIFPNPDGWSRGDRDTGTQFYQRYNGNGVDLNRDWPEQGFTYRPYTPWSEPESKSFGKVLQAIGPHDRRGKPKWTGGIDLHGQLIDRAFSFTLIGGSQRPYGKNQRVLQTVKGAWRDAEKRLAWSPMIKPNDAPQQDPRMYGVQWGTIWDTIDYTVTGALGNWIDSPIGLNADGIDNEMSLSHVSNCGIGSCWDPDVEQLHVDGNKSLVYAMINYSLKPEKRTFRTKGRVAYVHNPGFVSERTSRLTVPPRFAKLPPQKDIQDVMLSQTNGFTHQFAVKGPDAGVYNGGLAAEITCSSLQGTSPSCAFSRAVLERKASKAHRDAQGEEWEVVNSYYNQSPIYLQAGKALHANLPTKGPWRVRLTGTSSTDIYRLNIDFTKEKAWPDPGQIGYRVTNMKFWKMFKRFSRPRIERITAGKLATTNRWKRRYDTIVITNKVYRGLSRKLRKWVIRQNGNLVLLDKAVKMLNTMKTFKGGAGKGAINLGKYYAGYTNFATTRKENTYKHPLARNINQPGAAEGGQEESDAIEGEEVHRHQVYEPVPLNFAIQTPDDDDAFNSPVWWVKESAWKQLLGTQQAVGTTGHLDQVSFGQIKFRGGRIRIIGGLLPMPTKKFDNPYGVANYALTYSGYEMLKNVLKWNR